MNEGHKSRSQAPRKKLIPASPRIRRLQKSIFIYNLGDYKVGRIIHQGRKCINM